MSVEISGDMIGIGEASTELDRLMAADAAAGNSPGQPNQPDQSATSEAQRAAQPENKDAKPNEISDAGKPAAGTPANADKSQQTETKDKPDGKTDSQAASEAGKTLSRFAKEQQRRDRTWKEINEAKEALRKEQDNFRAEQDRLTQDREQLAKQQQPFSADQYDEAARKFEAAGKFDLAEAARERAAELRKNPPATPQQQTTLRQQQEAHQAQMKEWMGKAAVDFPEVAKDGSATNVALKSFLQQEPEAVKSPKGMYYAARLVNAEQEMVRLKTELARVPELEKELGALRAKVKEQDALTAPNPPSIPARAGAPAAELQGDTMDTLEREAMAMGPLR